MSVPEAPVWIYATGQIEIKDQEGQWLKAPTGLTFC